MVYFIVYTSNIPNYTNAPLMREVRSFSGWVILNQSSFLVATETSDGNQVETDIAQVKERLWAHCSEGERLFVGHFGNFAIWDGFDHRIRAWLIRYATHQTPNVYSTASFHDEEDASDTSH